MSQKDGKPYTRYREESTLSPESIDYVIEDLLPPIGPDTDGTIAGHISGLLGAMTDTVTPRYKALIAEGAVINNPMNHAETDYRFGGSGFVDTLTIGGVQQSRAVYTGKLGALHEDNIAKRMTQDFGLPDGLSNEILIHQAAVKARNRVAPVHFQSIVSLVELPKTVRLLTNAFFSVAYLVRGVTKGRWSDVKRSLAGRKTKLRGYKRFARDTATQRWLELRYGWTPLMLEIQGLSAALSTPPEIQVRQVARGFDKSNYETSIIQVHDGGPIYGVETLQFDISRKTNVRAYVLFDIGIKNFQTLRDFGLTDLPQAAWELMPLSFVIDWFTPVGNWLEAISPKLGINTLAEGYTIESEYTVRRTITSQTDGPGSTSVARVGSVGTTDTYRTRTKNRHTNLNVLASFPPFNVRINVKRALDAVALITGNARGPSIRS